MYLEHFGLGVNPFGLSPKLDFLYKSGAFEESIAHLVYGLDNSEAIVMITGAIGTGKTMSLQSFLANLGPGFHSALVTNTQVDAKSFLKLVLEDLEVEFPIGCDKADLLIQFKNFLLEASLQRRRVIIIVDEAQNLSPEVLEEVRLLTNLGQGEGQPVQIILVGQPELEHLVNQPSLAQLRQRIRVHYRLDPLSRAEIEEYLSHRMAVAGCRERVFAAKAIDRIYELSRGVPRLVNSLAGGALLCAFVDDRRQVEARDVEEPEPFQPAAEPVPVPAAAPAPTPTAVRPPAPVTEPGSKPAFVFAQDPEPAPDPATEIDVPPRGRTSRGTPVLGVVAVIVLAIAAGAYIASQFGSDLGDILRNLVRPGSATTASTEQEVAPPRMPVREPAAAVEFVPDEPVRVESAVVSDEPAAASEPLPVVPEVGAPEAEPYYVHVVSFRERTRATAYVDSLAGENRAAIVKYDVVFGNEWFRVWLGPFPDETAARNEIDHLRTVENLQYYSLQRASDVPGS